MKLRIAEEMSSYKIPGKILCLVVGFSFFKSFSPILSYWVPYMVQVKGLTNFQIANQVLPMYAYATLMCTLLAAPACEFLTCQTIIVFGSFTSLFSLLLLRFGTAIFFLYIVEVLVAFSAASVFIYQAYLFILVTEPNFPTITGFSQAAGSMAVFLSAELGQILVLIGLPYDTILYITIAAASTTCVLSFMLPKSDFKDQEEQLVLNLFSKSQDFWSVMKATWKDTHLQLLSIWWIFAMAGFQLSLNYSTTLFEAINSASLYNGQVVAIGTALAVIMALASVYLKRPLAKLGGFVYIVGSIVYGALCLGLFYSRTLWMAYMLFIVMVGVEKLLLCFLFAQSGSLVRNEKYALMFSFNCGLAQAAQAVIQAALEVASANIFIQYLVLGSFFIVIGVLFSVPYAMICFKFGTIEVFSEVESGPKPTKVESVNEPLMANEISI